MVRIDRALEQGSHEWLALRKHYIGASDAAAIMGVSPYKSAYSLWREKLGALSQKGNSSMAFGRQMEPEIRRMFEQHCGEEFSPCVVFNESYPWAMASMDAISADGCLSAEIKVANAADHEIAKAGNIPEKYKPQCQHQLMLLEHGFMFYVSYHKGDIVVNTVMWDEEYVKKLINAEREFWYTNIQQLIPPPQLTKGSKNAKNKKL